MLDRAPLLLLFFFFCAHGDGLLIVTRPKLGLYGVNVWLATLGGDALIRVSNYRERGYGRSISADIATGKPVITTDVLQPCKNNKRAPRRHNNITATDTVLNGAKHHGGGVGGW